MNKKELKVLIADLPPETDTQDFLSNTLIPFLLKLERGEVEFYFFPSGKVEKFVGGLHAVLGYDSSLGHLI